MQLVTSFQALFYPGFSLTNNMWRWLKGPLQVVYSLETLLPVRDGVGDDDENDGWREEYLR